MASTTFTILSSPLSNYSVDAVVGAAPDLETLTTDSLFNHYGMPQMSTVARSGLLSIGANYPYKTRVVPSATFSGMPLQNFGLFRLGYQRVLSFNSDDFTLSKAALDLNDQVYSSVFSVLRKFNNVIHHRRGLCQSFSDSTH